MRQDGYDPTREIALESRFAIGNGLIGVRGSREVSRGPVWMYWQEPPELGLLATHLYRRSL